MFSSKSSTPPLTAVLLVCLGLFSQPSHAGYQLMDDCAFLLFCSFSDCGGTKTNLEGSDDAKTLLTDAFTKIRDMIGTARNYNLATTSANGKQLFQSLYGEQPASGQMSGSVDNILDGVLRNASPVQGDAQGGDTTSADVQIYCTDKRFIKKTNSEGKERRWDPSTEEWVDKKECNMKEEVAYCVVPTDTSKPDTIQVCEWYMDYLLSIDPRFQSKWDKNIFKKSIKYLGVKYMEHKYAPVDLFSLAEKTLLHELTHSRNGQQLDDPREMESYGWKNCREMSSIRGAKDAPNHNADTFALWVSGCQIIEDGGQIGEDGKLTLAAGSAATRRSINEFNAALLKSRALL